MTTQQINEAIIAISERRRELESAFIENGGEITEETEAIEADVNYIKDIILGDGVDSLGRWLKVKEDEKDVLKDEKAKIDRMIKANENTIAYIKGVVKLAMDACGEDKVKGLLYSFKRSQSVTHTADLELIEDRYHDRLEKAAKEAGLPDWLRVKISPSWSLVPSGVETDEFVTSTTDTVTFTKPRKIKKDESQ